MTDQTSPSNNQAQPVGAQSQSVAQPTSYVDSYQPPVGEGQAPKNNVASKPKSDPLAELEKLLKEYEAKAEKVKSVPKPANNPANTTKANSDFASKLGQTTPVVTPQPSVPMTSAPILAMPAKNTKDPLKELEEALKRYEERKKQAGAVAKTGSVTKKPKVEQVSKPKVKPEPKVKSPQKSKSGQSLKELEKLLHEYEDRRKSKTGGRPNPKPAQKSAPAVNPKPVVKPVKRDPLAELEKALEKYETKSEKKPVVAPQPVVTPTPTPKPAKEKQQKDPLAELEKLLAGYDKKTEQPKQAPAGVSQKSKPKFERVVKPADSKPIVSAPQAVKTQAPTPTPTPTPTNQSIEEQNIFELLGVADSSDQEKEAFLDELQEAIWEDFLNKDLELLVTSEELSQLQGLRDQVKQNTQDMQLQEKLVDGVEKLIPDVEEIMLEKALELKEDMVWERVAGMKEYYQGRSEVLQKIEEAGGHLKKGHWQMGVSILNALVP